MKDYITADEIANTELQHEDGVAPIRKVYECLMIDGDVLSDGEVIDMCISYIQSIGGDELE